MRPSIRPWIGALVLAFGVTGVAGTGNAFIIIEHNGVRELGEAPVLPGTGEVGVALLQGTLPACGGFDAELCFFKIWTPGSQRQTHTMTLTFGAEDPPADISGIPFVEFVGNGTGVPWTDYHLSLSGEAGLLCCEAGILNGDFELIGIPGIDGVGTSSITFFFDPALASFSLGGGGDFVLVFAGLIEDPSGSLTISQFPTIPHPATLGLLALGFAGLGLVRWWRHA